jgi:hypothetical protein
MKKNEVIIIGVVFSALIIFLATQKSENLKQKKEIEELKKDRLKLIQKILKTEKEIPAEIKNQLLKLVTEYKDIDPDVSQELMNTLLLIENNHQSKAIATLAKIIENLLRDKFAEEILHGKYNSDIEFKSKKKRLNFKNIIEFAKNVEFLTEHEFNLLNILREFRDKESHELNIKIGKNWQTIAFLTGIEIVFKILGNAV